MIKEDVVVKKCVTFRFIRQKCGLYILTCIVRHCMKWSRGCAREGCIVAVAVIIAVAAISAIAVIIIVTIVISVSKGNPIVEIRV